MRARTLMIQGTGSSVGKSLITAGLCRLFSRQGLSVAPFKSQNMSLNSFATREGHEMGRAQAVQAEAAGIEPSALMNPVLLKPSADHVSQVIVNGRVRAVMSAREYYAFRYSLRDEVMQSFNALAARHDLIIIEGAGSPAEINLRENDLANMGMAAMAQSTPGAIAINLSALAGYKVAGLPGAIISCLAALLPPLLVLGLVSMFYSALIANPPVNAVLKGMQAGDAAVVVVGHGHHQGAAVGLGEVQGNFNRRVKGQDV